MLTLCSCAQLGADFNDHIAEATVASLNSGIKKLSEEGHHPDHTDLLVKMLKRRGAALCQYVQTPLMPLIAPHAS